MLNLAGRWNASDITSIDVVQRLALEHSHVRLDPRRQPRGPAGRLPRLTAGPGMALGAAGLAGAALLAALVPVPAHMLSPDVTYAAEWLTGIPVALYPVWLIVLSYRLPGHLTGRVGNDAPHPPGQDRP